MTVIFEFLLIMFKKIWEKIGFVGILIIILSVWLAIYHNTIQDKNEKISELEGTISTLNKSIAKQNDSIAESGRNFKILQNVLEQVDGENKDVGKTFTEIRTIYINKPIADTCDKAIEEIREHAMKNAEVWNKK